MSHLALVIKCKQELAEAGVLCAVQQSELLSEAYIRAGIAYIHRHGNVLTQDIEKRIWKMLDKWNSVSPINAPFINQSIIQRLNLLQGALANFGALPCPKAFTAVAELPEERSLDVGKQAWFQDLVDYLVKEMEACHE